jgi:hypothetical protein
MSRKTSESSVTLVLEPQEVNALLAGLALLADVMWNESLPANIADIASNSGETEMLDIEQIDSLAERINLSP